MIKSVQVIITALALALAATGAFAAKDGQPGKKDALPVPSQSQKENLNRNSGDDKLQGLDRARERMSEEGLENAKSDEAQAKKKPKSKKK